MVAKPTSAPQGLEHRPSASVFAARRTRLALTTALVLAVSCNVPGQPAQVDSIKIGGTGGADGSFIPSAEAASPDAGDSASEAGVGTEVLTPKDEARISLEFLMTPGTGASGVIKMMSGKPFPYPCEVAAMDEDGKMVVTLYLPRGHEITLCINPEGAEGESIDLILDPLAKLAFTEVNSGMSGEVIRFEEGVQQPVYTGENILQSEPRNEFLGGRVQSVLHGIYEAKEKETLTISRVGGGAIYSFINGNPVEHSGDFTVEIEPGQVLGLYPVVTADGETVTLKIKSSSKETRGIGVKP